MNRLERIKKLLTTIEPFYLEVKDDSAPHQGHIGVQELVKDLAPSSSPETHFTIKIGADIFTGKSLVKQHQIVNNLLANEFDKGLHALSIQIVKAR